LEKGFQLKQSKKFLMVIKEGISSLVGARRILELVQNELRIRASKSIDN